MERAAERRPTFHFSTSLLVHLGSTGFTRRRAPLRLAARLATGLPLRAAAFAAAHALRRLLDAFANALGLLRRLLAVAFLFLGLGGGIVFAPHQLDVRHFGGVTATVAHAQDARVTARSVREPRRQRLEQLANDVGVGQLGED